MWTMGSSLDRARHAEGAVPPRRRERDAPAFPRPQQNSDGGGLSRRDPASSRRGPSPPHPPRIRPRISGRIPRTGHEHPAGFRERLTTATGLRSWRLYTSLNQQEQRLYIGIAHKYPVSEVEKIIPKMVQKSPCMCLSCIYPSIILVLWI